MKVRITHLKAPWPAGAKVGDVVQLGGRVVPGWAVGKCEHVDESVEATAGFPDEEAAEHPEVTRIRQAAEQAMEHAMKVAAAEREQLMTAHAAELRDLKASHAAALADMQARIDQAIAGDAAKHQALLDSNADLTKKLADALAAKAPSGKR